MGFSDSPNDYSAQADYILNGLRDIVKAEVAKQLEFKLKEWEPTQNIRLTVTVETPDKK